MECQLFEALAIKHQVVALATENATNPNGRNKSRTKRSLCIDHGNSRFSPPLQSSLRRLFIHDHIFYKDQSTLLTTTMPGYIPPLGGTLWSNHHPTSLGSQLPQAGPWKPTAGPIWQGDENDENLQITKSPLHRLAMDLSKGFY